MPDLPWSQHRVRFMLTVHRFFCDRETCPWRIFTGRLPGVVAPYARRTARLTDILRLLAFALGGEPGIAIVSRDRAQVYADGARRGAPNAVQVADRFQLLKNLGEALHRLLLRGLPARIMSTS